MKTNKRIAQYLVFRIQLVLLRFKLPSTVSHKAIILESKFPTHPKGLESLLPDPVWRKACE